MGVTASLLGNVSLVCGRILPRTSRASVLTGLIILLVATGAGGMTQPVHAGTLMFVSEYGSGNILAFDPATGAPAAVPAGYLPVGSVASGADGMVTDSANRLYVTRENGTIYRRTLDGQSFDLFATMPGATSDFYLLDLTGNNSDLFAARFASNMLYRVSMTTAAVTTFTGPVGADRFDGVRIGPDNRLYAVDSQDGQIFAYNLATSSWSVFLDTPPTTGIASQMEFADDGRVFVSRTIGGQARIYAYTLLTPGDYSLGLDPLSETLIGSFGSSDSDATGIRIGPDGRLYANAFNLGEVWRSNIGITSMEASALITGLDLPGSIYFAAIPEPASLLVLGAGTLLILSRRRHGGARI